MRSKLLCSRWHAGIVLFASNLASWSSVGSKAVVTAYVPCSHSTSSSPHRYTNTFPKRHDTTAWSLWKTPNIIRSPPLPSSSVLFSSASGTTVTTETPLPTIEQLSSDPFINQVSYAERVIAVCLMIDKNDTNTRAEDAAEENDKNKLEIIKAQLSHSDGIRGFFVTYLTAMPADDDDSDFDTNTIPPADRMPVPPLLVEAMKSVADADDLIRLACMNVIMPTGMITMHTNAQLSAQSKITAIRGVRVLDSLNSIYPMAVQHHVATIYAVATSSSSSSSSSSGKADNEADELIGFWTRFFEKWGYQQEQRNDISKAVQSIMK